MENQWNNFTKLFDRDPYLQEASLTVTSCEKLTSEQASGATYRIAFADTLFYPEGGGQPGDSGFIGEARVFDTQYLSLDPNEAPQIVHYTDKPLVPGQTYLATLDFGRRFSHMQQHSGEHILSGLVHKHFGYRNVGFHMGEQDMTVDFSGPLNPSQIDAIIREVNEVIWQNLPLETSILSAEEAESVFYRSKLDLKNTVRIVKIPGADSCACSGTHVHHTGEIGNLLCTKSEKWKQGVRLTLLAGDRALHYAMQNQVVVKELSHRLHLPTQDLGLGLTRLEARIEDLEAGIRQTANDIWAKLVHFDQDLTLVLLTWPLFDEVFIKYQLKQFASINPGKSLLLFLPSAEGKLRFFLVEQESQTLLGLLRSQYQAKGGGPFALSQGQVPCSGDPEAYVRDLASSLGGSVYVL